MSVVRTRARGSGLTFEVRAFGGPAVSVSCGLAGRHNAANVLAGLTPATVWMCRSSARPRRGGTGPAAGGAHGSRFPEGAGGSGRDTLQPPALCAVLRELVTRPAGRHILVAGDMLELGEDAERLHRECGALANELPLHLVVGVGSLGRVLAETAAALGSSTLAAEDPTEAAALLAGALRPGDLVLFKASRAVGLDAALRLLEARTAASGGGA